MQVDTTQWRDAAEQAAGQAGEAGRRVAEAAAKTGSFLKEGAEFLAADKASYAGRAFWATVVALGATAFLLRSPLLKFPLGDLLVVFLGVPIAALVGELVFRHLAPVTVLSVRQGFVASAIGFAPALVYDLFFMGARAGILYVATLLFISWVFQVFWGTAALRFWHKRLNDLNVLLDSPMDDEGQTLREALQGRFEEIKERLRRR